MILPNDKSRWEFCKTRKQAGSCPLQLRQWKSALGAHAVNVSPPCLNILRSPVILLRTLELQMQKSGRILSRLVSLLWLKPDNQVGQGNRLLALSLGENAVAKQKILRGRCLVEKQVICLIYLWHLPLILQHKAWCWAHVLLWHLKSKELCK